MHMHMSPPLADCLPDYLSPDEKLANCPTCMICQQRATHYLR
jgi:hypothetical protein